MATRYLSMIGIGAVAMVTAPILFARPAAVGPAPIAAQEAAEPAPATGTPRPRLRAESATIVARYPHDAGAFTQGLIWYDGALYESVGQPGVSEVRRVDLTTGRVRRRARIPAPQFGEGLARWQGELISLTWTSGIAHRWDARTLKSRGQFRYPGEGWGLTTLGDSLILSDGTSDLRVLDPTNFAERRRIPVRLGDTPVDRLNELEVIDGLIFANIWFSNLIIAIDPATGQVTRAIDLSPVVREVAPADRDAVLNGIAWDGERRRLFVTGKYWPTLFEIRLDDAAP
ncbi:MULTISPECIES: glutaminyl-peptide cyclotransferase [unclassified Sphingomonas]|jgi:glutamine cyclotransferase|nr:MULTISPECIES: glutaminyl-peptide cyclotransferase [unclassified Sphingomonas]